MAQRYVQEYNKISSEKHVPLCPRLYQSEMVQFAASRNALLVAPTGCGKTKIIAMLLDELWKNNPSAKVEKQITAIALCYVVTNTSAACFDTSNCALRDVGIYDC